jgi:hypothetical protein
MALLERAYNFHWVVPGEMARMAQAHVGGLAGILTRNGLKALLNLRGHNPDYGWWRRDVAACERAGAKHFDLMLDSRRLPTKAMLTGLFDAFDTAPKSFVVKCAGGQDRTSLASALYILHRNGWVSFGDAELQFKRELYGHDPKQHQRWLKPFIAFAQEQARGVPVAQWVRDSYEPHILKEWLDARGMKDFYAHVFEKQGRNTRQWKW